MLILFLERGGSIFRGIYGKQYLCMKVVSLHLVSELWESGNKWLVISTEHG